MHGRCYCALALFLVAFASCDELPFSAPAAQEDAPQPEKSEFDPGNTGTIAGTVTWAGALPTVPPFRAPAQPLWNANRGPNAEWANPNRPAIDSTSRGLRDAVVFLRGIDPGRARPWSHSPVRVEVQDLRLSLRQGDQHTRCGIVRRGEEISFASLTEDFEVLQVRGRRFFSVPLTRCNQVLTRKATETGLLEISSGAGHFWMRAYLFVTDHPYFARTDTRGRFSLTQVPTGDYELVCWHPDWRIAERELDGDTSLPCRMTYRPSLEKARRISVRSGETAQMSFVVEEDLFP